jgi:hypothetical protein
MSAFTHLLHASLGTVGAVLLIVIVGALLARLTGRHFPLDPIHLAMRILGSDAAAEEPLGANVEIRDSASAPIELCGLVDAFMRNGVGRRYRASGSIFTGCDRRVIHQGAKVHIEIGHGTYATNTSVLLDPDRQTLFVRLDITTDELNRRLAGK